MGGDASKRPNNDAKDPNNDGKAAWMSGRLPACRGKNDPSWVHPNGDGKTTFEQDHGI